MLLKRLDADGFACVAGVLTDDDCAAIADKIAALDSVSAGTRCLLTQAWCRELAHRLQAHSLIAQAIPAQFMAVQCTYFEKSVERNWLVPIHQEYCTLLRRQTAVAGAGYCTSSSGRKNCHTDWHGRTLPDFFDDAATRRVLPLPSSTPWIDRLI